MNNFGHAFAPPPPADLFFVGEKAGLKAADLRVAVSPQALELALVLEPHPFESRIGSTRRLRPGAKTRIQLALALAQLRLQLLDALPSSLQLLLQR